MDWNGILQEDDNERTFKAMFRISMSEVSGGDSTQMLGDMSPSFDKNDNGSLDAMTCLN